MTSPAPVDSKQVIGRRTLHFNALDEALADVDTLAAANGRGELRCLGNWTPGQTLGHLASWVDYSFDGVPMKVPFFVRWIMKPMKGRMINQPMKAGRRIPKVPGGTLGIAPMSFDEGLAAFQRTFTRLKTETPQKPNVLFGPMSHNEWVKLHLRHAELHLSFLRNGPSA